MKQIVLASSLIAALTGASVAQSGAPRIDDVAWAQIDAYCIFQRNGQTLTFDNPDTWRFVFFSNLPNEINTDPLESPFMRLDGQLIQLEQTSVKQLGNGQLRSYSAGSDPAYSIQISMIEGEKGSESTAYSGGIAVTRNGQTSEVGYSGDCGV
jgi:hypothetical protein